MKNLKNIYAVIVLSMAFFHAQICSAQYSIWSETLKENADFEPFTSASDRDGNIYVAYKTSLPFSLETCEFSSDGYQHNVIKKFSPTGELLTAFDVVIDYAVNSYSPVSAFAVDRTGDAIYVLMSIVIDEDSWNPDICLAKFRKNAFGSYTLQWSRLLYSYNADETEYVYTDLAHDLVLVQGFGSGHQIYISGYMANHGGNGKKYVVYRYDADGNVIDFYNTTDQTVDGQNITIADYGIVDFVHLKSVGGRLYAVTEMNHTLTVGGLEIRQHDLIIIKFGEYIYPDNLGSYEEHIFLDENALVDDIQQVDIGRNDDVYLLGTGKITGTVNPLTMVNCIKLADGLSWSTYSLPSVPGTMKVQAMKLDDRGDNYLYIAGYNLDEEMTVLALRRNDGALYSSQTLNGVFDILFSEDVTVKPYKVFQFLVTDNHVYLLTLNETLSEVLAPDPEYYLFVNKLSKNLSEYTFVDIIPYIELPIDDEEYVLNHHLNYLLSVRNASPKMRYHAGTDALSIIYNYVNYIDCYDTWYDYVHTYDLKIRTHVDGLFDKEQDEAMLHTYEVELYPNPASEYIELSADTESEMQYKILNAAGMLVGEGTMQQAATIDVKSLAKGLYTIQFFTQDTMMRSEKFIVQ